jgi:hypothetical protein
VKKAEKGITQRSDAFFVEKNIDFPKRNSIG